MFSTSLENFLLFTSNSKLSSADGFNVDQSKILSSGNGLILLNKKLDDETGKDIPLRQSIFKVKLRVL